MWIGLYGEHYQVPVRAESQASKSQPASQLSVF